MLLSSSCIALRSGARSAIKTNTTAAANSRLFASRSESTANFLARSLSSVSYKGQCNKIGVASHKPKSSSSLSALSSSMSVLNLNFSPHSLLQNHRALSSTARLPSGNGNKEKLGEPITLIKLHNLADNPGAVKRARRIGRGIGCSKGKTSGRGHKGQKARAGKGVHPTFEGGQTKFYKRIPKRGKMKNANFKLKLVPINVGTVQDYVTMGRLIPERSDGVLTMRDFVNAGMITSSSVKSGVKLLGSGSCFVKDKLFIEVPWASASAVEAIESKGGYVTTVHHNRLALRAALKPHKFPEKPENMLRQEFGEINWEGEEGMKKELDVEDMHLLPKRARPPPKYMQYYTDYSKRGYLNPKVQLERKQRGLKDVH